MNRAVFLDRDGTINYDKHYLYKQEDFEFIPGAIEGMQILQSMDYKLIIITNQSGIARGLYAVEDFYKLNEWMLETLVKNGVKIEAVYFCPHLPNASLHEYRLECDCRKPALGLFKRQYTRRT